MLISQREFASRVGVTEGAVSRAIKAGRLLQMKGKRIETDHHLSVEYASLHHAASGKVAVKTKKKSLPSALGRQNITQINAQTANINVPADLENADAVELSFAKKLADLEKVRLENAILRGEHIEREIVGQWIMRFYGTMSSMFRAMSGRVMPDMIAKIRSSANDDDAMRDGSKLIDDAVYEGLQQIRDVMLAFRKKVPELELIKDDADTRR